MAGRRLRPTVALTPGRSDASPAAARRVGRPPRTKDAEAAARAAVVVAARRLFDSEGYDAVSMRRIAAAAGLAAPTLYGLFRGKRDLLRRIWDADLSRAAAVCEAAAPRRLRPRARLRAFGRVWVRYWLARREQFRVIFLVEDRPVVPGDSYWLASSGILDRFATIAAVIRDAISRGDLPPRDADTAAQAYFCLLQGLVGSLVMIPEFPWTDRDVLIDGAIDTFLDGLRSRRRRHESR